MRRKTKLKSEVLRRKAVDLAKKIARKLQNYTCEYCGKREPAVKTHGSHIYSEGVHRAMSADVDNILCLCFTHHLGRWSAKEPSWHNNPIEMIGWFNKNYPERAEMLKQRSFQSPQCDEYYWRIKLDALEKWWAQLQQ